MESAEAEIPKLSQTGIRSSEDDSRGSSPSSSSLLSNPKIPTTATTVTPDNVTPRKNDRFPATDPASYLSHLDEHGYVVVAGVLPVSDVVRSRELLWDFLEEKTETWKRDDMRTWVSTDDDDTSDGGDERCFSRIADRGAENGILHRGGVGQSEAAWFVRERVARSGVFQRVWDRQWDGETAVSDLVAADATPTHTDHYDHYNIDGEKKQNYYDIDGENADSDADIDGENADADIDADIDADADADADGLVDRSPAGRSRYRDS